MKYISSQKARAPNDHEKKTTSFFDLKINSIVLKQKRTNDLN